MAKGSMKSFWNDRRREDDRLKKLVTRKKPSEAVSDNGTGTENSAELKPEEKQEK